jgi:hypothetical protein
MLFTARDRSLVEWIGRFGAVEAEQVMAWFGMGRTATYRRLRACVQAGLLVHARVLHGEPGLYVATRAGLQWAGLGDFEPSRVSVALVRHAQASARAAVILDQREPRMTVVHEREIRAAERSQGRVLASVAVGSLGEGRSRWHRPDLLLVPSEGDELPAAIELELSVKSRRRLEAICRGYARSRLFASVRYYAEPEPARAVARAVEATRTDDLIRVLPIATLLQGELSGEERNAA